MVSKPATVILATESNIALYVIIAIFYVIIESITKPDKLKW